MGILSGFFHTLSEDVSVPVVLITFNRPQQTKKVLEALALEKPRTLIVISDGPRESNDRDVEAVRETRDLFRNVPWDCSVERIYSETNLGVRERVLTALDIVFNQHDEAIILEDDCVPSGDFLHFAQSLLAFFRETETVASIAGFNNGAFQRRSHGFFYSIFPEIWGWATWSSTWHRFRHSDNAAGWSEQETAKTLAQVKSPLARRKLRKLAVLNRTISTWDIDFALHLVREGLMTVIPKTNLVTNIGFGSGATHTRLEPLGIVRFHGHINWPLAQPRRTKAKLMKQEIEQFVISTRALARILGHPVSSFQWLISACKIWTRDMKGKLGG